MYTEYGDNVLARSIVEERLMLRERIKINVPRNPFVGLKHNFDIAVSAVQKWLEKPDALPVYCFEYAPDC